MRFIVLQQDCDNVYNWSWVEVSCQLACVTRNVSQTPTNNFSPSSVWRREQRQRLTLHQIRTVPLMKYSFNIHAQIFQHCLDSYIIRRREEVEGIPKYNLTDICSSVGCLLWTRPQYESNDMEEFVVQIFLCND